MKTVTVESALASIRKYLGNDVATPFVVVVDDSFEYSNIINESWYARANACQRLLRE